MVKVGGADPIEPPEYLADWKPDTWGIGVKDAQWTDRRSFAHRFTDRNTAARLARAVEDYSEDIRIVRVVSKVVRVGSDEKGPDR